MHAQFLEHAAREFEAAKRALMLSSVDASVLDHVAVLVLIAARLESLERGLEIYLPQAGRG